MAEVDRNYAAFYDTWKRRLGLKDIHIAESYMRGEANDLEGYGTLPDDPTKSGVHIRVDGRGLDANVDPADLGAMINEWQRHLDATPMDVDQRTWTKRFIIETVGLNRHLEGDGPVILLAAVWLVRDSAEVMDALRIPGFGLLCDFTFEEDRATRLRTSVLGRKGEAGHA